MQSQENWRDVIHRVRGREAERYTKLMAELKADREKDNQRLGEAASLMLPALRRATIDDYRQWLKGFIENGGEPTNSYNYEFGRWTFYVATTDFSTVSLYGSESFSIIIPKGIKVNLSRGKGHINLFYMDGFKGSCVPIFNDI